MQKMYDGAHTSLGSLEGLPLLHLLFHFFFLGDHIMIATCLAFFSIVCVYQERGSALCALLQVLAGFLLLLEGRYLELRGTEVSGDLWTPDLAGIGACARMLCFVLSASVLLNFYSNMQ